MSQSDVSHFSRGIKLGIPIALGYFAVAMTLGLTAQSYGITPLQATLCSALLNASAGGYAAFNAIGTAATYFETAVLIAIANARYLLMSCALSQVLSPAEKLRTRILLGFYVTDELFGVSMSESEKNGGKLIPLITYGAICVAGPAWALGTLAGAVLGNVLPFRVVSAFSVGLFGMFLAIIIPPAKKEKVVACLVGLSFLASGLVAYFLPSVSEGERTIILTVMISAAAALLFPRPERDEGGEEYTEK